LPEATVAAPPDLSAGERRRDALRAYWLAPPGLVMAAAAGLALGLRLYLLSRPGYLTGITEYDDGVYLGGALRLLSGALPYHDYAFVQPPGILLLMTPAAALAKLSGAASALAAARLLTAFASAASVVLAGALVRYRGTLVTATTCALLAVYPDDIATAHTLLLEPWMNLLLLAGAGRAFREGRLRGPRALLGAGVLFGLAGAVKYWAAIPAFGLLVVCLTVRPAPDEQLSADGRIGAHGRISQAAWFGGGTVAAFAVAVAPFAAPWPGLFVRSTLLDQAARAGSAVPESLRLANLTGLGLLLDDAGRFTGATASSLFARSDVTAAATWATGGLPVLLAVAGLALACLGYSAGGLRPLGWYAAGVLAGTAAAVLGYSAFFYHYGDFAAPWLALSAGFTVAGLRERTTGLRVRLRRAGRAGRAAPGDGRRRPGGVLTAAVLTAAVLAVAAWQGWQLSGLHAADVRADAALIPPGACVVTDEISLAVAASRFTAGQAGCPDVLDSLATTLVADNGVSIQGGADRLPPVVADWKRILAQAGYVWLSSSSDRRIPWTTGLRTWFARTFQPLDPPPGQVGEGQLYVRRGPRPNRSG
jgi:hypothetical protein